MLLAPQQIFLYFNWIRDFMHSRQVLYWWTLSQASHVFSDTVHLKASLYTSQDLIACCLLQALSSEVCYIPILQKNNNRPVFLLTGPLPITIILIRTSRTLFFFRERNLLFKTKTNKQSKRKRVFWWLFENPTLKVGFWYCENRNWCYFRQ